MIIFNNHLLIYLIFVSFIDPIPSARIKYNKPKINACNATESQHTLYPNFSVTYDPYKGPKTYPRPKNIL